MLSGQRTYKDVHAKVTSEGSDQEEILQDEDVELTGGVLKVSFLVFILF